MPRTVDYYFTLQSPWTYLGSEAFHAIARQHGATIRYRPVLLLEVFNETGGLPLAKRHPARQAYRFIELQRWRAQRNLPLNLRPKGFPFDASLADRIVIALALMGRAPEAYLAAAHRGVWVEDKNLADPETLRALLGAVHEDAEAALAKAGSEEVIAAYAANRDHALAAGVFGAPGYVLDGEVFWGQDRLDQLDAALASGRAPYLPDTDR